MIKINNPAGRLYRLLEQAIHAGTSQHPPKTIREAWMIVFEIDESDKPRLFELLGSVVQLSRQTKSQIEARDDINHGLYLASYSRIEIALSITNLEESSTKYRDLLMPDAMKELGFCSDALARLSPESEITPEELKDLEMEITHLSNLIDEALIDPGLKQVLLSLLERMRHALAEYRIRGMEAIEEVVAYVVGATVMTGPLISQSKDSESVKGFTKLLFRFHSFVKGASPYATLAR